MTDYLTNLSARSLNKARVVRPRVPMRFESFNKKMPFFQEESRDITETDGQKRLKPYAMNSSVTEDIKVEPQLFFTGVKQLPIPKSQSLNGTIITDKVVSRETQTQMLGQHEVISPPKQIPQSEKLKGKLVENTVFRNEMAEPKQVNNISSINASKLKRVTHGEYPRVLPEQEPIKIHHSTGAVSTSYVNNTFSSSEIPKSLMDSPEISKSMTNNTQKSLTSVDTRRKMSTLLPANQYRMTGQSESVVVKTFLPKGQVFTPQVIRKYSQVPGIDTRKMTAEEKSIQVTIGRVEIRAVPPEKPQKQRREPKVLSLEDYSKRHTGS